MNSFTLFTARHIALFRAKWSRSTSWLDLKRQLLQTTTTAPLIERFKPKQGAITYDTMTTRLPTHRWYVLVDSKINGMKCGLLFYAVIIRSGHWQKFGYEGLFLNLGIARTVIVID